MQFQMRQGISEPAEKWIINQEKATILKLAQRTFMKKIYLASTLLCAFVASSVIAQEVPAAGNPIFEKFPENVTFYLNFDDGTNTPSIGSATPWSQNDFLIEGKGFLGKALKAGDVNMSISNTAIDPTIPGTCIAWLCPVKNIDPVDREPGFEYFQFGLKDRYRLFGMKQADLPWKAAWFQARVERPDAKNNSLICNDSATAPEGSATAALWKAGEWKMIAVTWTSGNIGISINGEKAIETGLKEPLPRFDERGFICIRAGKFPDKKGFEYMLDEFVVLNKKLTDAELKAVYDASLQRRAELAKPK